MHDDPWLKRFRRMLACLCICLLVPALAFASTGTVVNTKTLRLRKSNSTKAEVLYNIPKGEQVTIVATKGDWYQVKYGKYAGYVMKEYVQVGGKASTASSSSKSSGTSVPAPTVDSLKVGDSGENVKRLQRRLKELGFYSGPISGEYGSATRGAVKNYQKKIGYSDSGTCNAATMKRLFPDKKTTSSSEKDSQETASSTKRLDWFAGNNANRIPKGATFTVKDVKTGKTFTAKRWSGANHLDAEPLSSSDTATLRQIYGGAWSWTRRAVLVKYNGQVYAASINGMPHGEQTIDDNGFSGHFCIHFYGSKTHGTQRVDEAHQNCESQAMRATW